MSEPNFSLGFNFEVDNTFYSFSKRCIEILYKSLIESQFKVIQTNVCAYVCRIVLASVFFVAWYKIVKHRFFVAYHGISHLSLVFSRYTHSLIGSCVYLENTSDTWDIQGYILLESGP